MTILRGLLRLLLYRLCDRVTVRRLNRKIARALRVVAR